VTGHAVDDFDAVEIYTQFVDEIRRRRVLLCAYMSMCLSIGHDREELCKNGGTDRDAVWGVNSWDPENYAALAIATAATVTELSTVEGGSKSELLVLKRICQ